VPAPENKILVIRGGAIGDFILTLPVFAALRGQFPITTLEALGYPHIAQLAGVGRLVDAVHSIDARPMAGFFARRGKLDANLAAFFRRTLPKCPKRNLSPARIDQTSAPISMPPKYIFNR
jgi:hypothetical protein